MAEVVVIADDLTGAADTGATFARRGLDTVVSLDGSGDGQVLAVDTQGRSRSREDAARRAGGAAGRHVEASVLYKKLDSTLRGAVGPELAAIAEATGRRVVAAPAFPATGRTVRDGILFVHGVRLAEAGVWREADGVPPRDIPSLLFRAGVPTHVIDVATVRGSRLRTALAEVPSERVAICDAETDADLGRIARAGATLAEPVVWAGSAGLAAHLPATLGLIPRGGSRAGRAPTSGSILVVVGTPSAVAAGQVRHLLHERQVREVAVDAEALLDPGGRAFRGSEEALRHALDGGDAVLTIARGAVIGTERGAVRAASSVGTLVRDRLAGLGGFVGTGGETVRAVLDAAGIPAFKLDGEVEPGVAVGRLGVDGEVRLVTKAGAFGDTVTLVHAYDALRAGG
ncbi:MAG: four-carbon acid sugar kinase family protein [Streptosporangiaceae bacterium]